MLTQKLSFLLAALSLAIFLAAVRPASADFSDWAEGTPGKDDGATRDYYNRAALLEWKNKMGDWRDAKNNPQGKDAYAVVMVGPEHKGKFAEWDVTELVREWLDGKYPNQGMFLRVVQGQGSRVFASKEAKEDVKRPQLVLKTDAGSHTPALQADTFLDSSTYRCQGHLDQLRVSGSTQHALLRFDLGSVPKPGKIKQAVLRLYNTAQYGNPAVTVGVFRCSQGHDVPDTEPIHGLAANYPGDRGIAKDPDVIFFTDFESPKWQGEWSHVANLKRIGIVENDPLRKFAPWQGKALSANLAKGENTALNTLYRFKQKTGSEPEEMYFRYYLRLGDDWNQTLQGGKFPGFSGTYGVAGWGGRKVNGSDGWSTRGWFARTIPDNNPLANRTPIGTYCYHADQKGKYGDTWVWSRGYRGYLEKNRWYCLEQYVRMNTPKEKDGILRAWVDGRLAFEKTDIRFRDVDRLKIEQLWMNVYHGGTLPSPYDQHIFIDNVVIAKKYIGPMK